MSSCAVPVVDLTEGDGYKLNEDELKQILLNKEIAGKKVVLISVAGAFRKGKSFLLNFFVHYLDWLTAEGEGEWFNEDTVFDKFHWRSGLKRDTVGMLLWNKPYILRDNNNEEVVVFLMDTQGLFDNKSTVQHCVTIFAMSTLISSIQEKENDLQHLRLFTEYAQLVKKKSTSAPFQKLMSLVRDWQNSSEHSYGFDGGDDYLENLLEISDDQEEELQAVRKNLKSSFEAMNCCLMPYPGSRIAQNNSQKVLGEMDEDFEDQIRLFVPSVFEQVEAKKIDGQRITCGDLFNLFKVYMEVFKNGKLPRPRSIFEATAQALNTAAEEVAKNEYERLMDEKLTADPDLCEHSTLVEYHDYSKDKTIELFENKPKLGGAETTETYKKSLLSGIEKRFNELAVQVEMRRKAKEEEERIAEERRKIAEEERRIEEERKRQQDLLEKMEADRVRQQEDARRREEQLEAEKRIQDEFYRKEQQRMDEERTKNEAGMAEMRTRQQELQDKLNEIERSRESFFERLARLTREQKERERLENEENERLWKEREEQFRREDEQPLSGIAWMMRRAAFFEERKRAKLKEERRRHPNTCSVM